MSSLPRRCKKTPKAYIIQINQVADYIRFVECEAWRKDIQLDELLPTWDYPEKPEIQRYYQQYYHKNDKVSCLLPENLLFND